MCLLGVAKAHAKKYVPQIEVVARDLKRRDIVMLICEWLRDAGFTAKYREAGRSSICYLGRIEEQKCFIERTQPYYLSETTKDWAKTNKTTSTLHLPTVTFF